MPKSPPVPTPIYRIVHLDCLRTLLTRDALHAPNHVPKDGLLYRGIHAERTQADRGKLAVRCGPRGVIADYVGFYFGPRSPMLFRIHTGRDVEQESQERIVYLVSSAQSVQRAGLGFVFADRHSLARVARFESDLGRLDIVDFDAANAAQWNTTREHPDRQEKKQAEFLVHRVMPWHLVERIGVIGDPAKRTVEAELDRFKRSHRPLVSIERAWYY